MAGQLLQFLPPDFQLLGQEDLDIVGTRPIAAGAFADVWVGQMGGKKVAVKSYRRYDSVDYTSASARFCHEVLEHPFALVLAFMEHLSLEQYLKSGRCIRRLDLLLGAARAVMSMHMLDLVHGNLKIQNFLVDADGCVRIAGFGAASIPFIAPPVDVDQTFYGAAPELIDPQRFGFVDAKTTKASDVYAFGIIAWEVFAERTPFSHQNNFAGMYSVLEGRRAARPDHPELSNRLWKLIEGCWKHDPVQRKTIAGVIAVLEAELNRPKYRVARCELASASQ